MKQISSYPHFSEHPFHVVHDRYSIKVWSRDRAAAMSVSSRTLRSIAQIVFGLGVRRDEVLVIDRHPATSNPVEARRNAPIPRKTQHPSILQRHGGDAHHVQVACKVAQDDLEAALGAEEAVDAVVP